jgi:hypothetical protein
MRRKITSLIPNHTLNGVDSNIRRHLKESKELLELVREYPRYVDSLERISAHCLMLWLFTNNIEFSPPAPFPISGAGGLSLDQS